jgi:cytochrome c oxidase subunit 2
MFAIRRFLPRTVLIAVLLAAAWSSAGSLAGQDEPREIQVVVRRFAFEPARIEAAVGERVRLLVVSADGVHGVEIRKFDVKKEIPRGKAPVAIEFTATEAGEFPILCSEYCGEGHNDMKGTLVVRARDEQPSEERPRADRLAPHISPTGRSS